MAGLARFVPFLLPWLVAALILQSAVKHAPNVPGSTVSVLTHGPGNCAIAALIALGSLWLLPGTRTARGRALWSVLALVVLALSATQNRGGLVGAAAGIAVGLAFFRQGCAAAADRASRRGHRRRAGPSGHAVAAAFHGRGPGAGVLRVAADHQCDQHRELAGIHQPGRHRGGP